MTQSPWAISGSTAGVVPICLREQGVNCGLRGIKRAIQNRTRYNCGLRHLLKHVLPYSTQTQPSAVQVKVVLYYTWPRARSSLQVEVLFGAILLPATTCVVARGRVWVGGDTYLRDRQQPTRLLYPSD